MSNAVALREVLGGPAREVHGAEGVLEPRVLGGRIDPASALELVDPPEALHPPRVDEVLLGLLTRRTRRREGDITVHRIAQQRRAVVEFFALRRPAHGKIIQRKKGESIRKKTCEATRQGRPPVAAADIRLSVGSPARSQETPPVQSTSSRRV